MKIHYFQRYNQKENVTTANTMLMISRLYTYSPNKFYKFISYMFPQNSDIEPQIQLQVKKGNAVPDAIISQPSFKIIIETKLNNQFDVPQLQRHITLFGDEEYKILLTIDPKKMDDTTKSVFDKELHQYNNSNNTNIIHYNTTFRELIENMKNVIDDRDYELLDIFNDFCDYCYEEDLMPNEWKRLWVRTAGDTFNINLQTNIYYDGINRPYSDHAYLGLYTQKSVRAIGKITDIIAVTNISENPKYEVEKGTLTDEMKNRIKILVDDAKNYGYKLENERFFFVDKFYDTDFQKGSSGSLWGTKVFDLENYLSGNIDENAMPDTQDIANELKNKTWQ